MDGQDITASRDVQFGWSGANQVVIDKHQLGSHFTNVFNFPPVPHTNGLRDIGIGRNNGGDIHQRDTTFPGNILPHVH